MKGMYTAQPHSDANNLSFRAVQIRELFDFCRVDFIGRTTAANGHCETRFRWQTFAEFIAIAVVGAKDEALFAGRVPHVRPSVHGLKKTGHSPFERFCNAAKRLRPRARVLAH